MLLLILVIIISAGCSSEDMWGSHKDKYQLVASSEGRVYRLNVKTGEVMVIEQGTMRTVMIANTSEKNSESGKAGGTNSPLPPGFKRGWVEPKKPGETIPEYLKRTKDPLGIR
jgi:hypothetical protein